MPSLKRCSLGSKGAFRNLLLASIWIAPANYFAHTAYAGEPKANRKSTPAYVQAHYDKPRVRSVHTNKATVRSGPSEQHYPTSKLPQGTQVDVYLETSDGWSAIRPPAGSHDWIPSTVAYLLPGGKTAEIIEEDSPAWIGSELPDAPDMQWQVALAKTQQVQILGEQLQTTDEGKKQLWYRIAPPQGEFRWVKTSQLSDTPTPQEAPQSVIDNAVQLTSHQEVISEGSENSGKVVWSDEHEAVAQVQRQIQREQAEITKQMSREGVNVAIPSPTLDLLSQSEEAADKARKPTSLLSIANIENADSNAEPTRLRPIPQRSKQSSSRIKGTQSLLPQDAPLPEDGNRMRVGPMNSVLGLIGLSVVEADHPPPTTQIAQQYHTTPRDNLGAIGPINGSRLDRLPRPGHRGPAMTVPPDTAAAMVYGGAPVASTSPLAPAESSFSRWLRSQDPIFGAAPGTSPVQPGVANYGGANMAYAPTGVYGTPAPLNPNPSSGAPDTSAWHGLNSSMRNASAASSVSTVSANVAEDSEEIREFQTPEIQSALVQLTQEVARPTEDWQFQDLKRQAAQWIEQGGSAMVRGEARLLMERIERFESLRQRTLGLASNAPTVAPQTTNSVVTPGVANMPTTVGSGATAVSNGVANMATQEGDASGWLVQVHTSYPGQPEFALTDDAGNVIAYVQSSAGLNLRRYLQQPVTIYGIRGYLPNLASKQILAERVVRMR